MPLRSTLRRILPLLLCAFPLHALAAGTLTGIVTNKTTGKPSAGDQVTLIRLQQAMEDMVSTKTDAHGRYTLQVPDDAIHLLRVTHDKASYFQPVQAGTSTLNVDVYDAAPHVEGVSTAVEELHVEATASELHIVEVLQVLNQSSPARTQFGPDGFEFYLPPDAHVVRAGAQRDGMPVPAAATPLGDSGHYTFNFPIRPGETQFGIFYTMPYTGQADINLKLASAIQTIAIMLPRSIDFKSAGSAPWKISNEGQAPGVQMWTASNGAAGQTLSFAVSGTGSLPAEGSQTSGQAGAQQGGGNGQPLPETENTAPGRGLQNPLDPEGTRDPWAKYKWWILSGLGVLLAAAAGVLLRKPHEGAAASFDGATPPSPLSYAQPVNTRALAGSPVDARFDALKEELFALETDHLQQRISEQEYLEHKAALELVLRRALRRSEVGSAVATTPSQDTER